MLSKGNLAVVVLIAMNVGVLIALMVDAKLIHFLSPWEQLVLCAIPFLGVIASLKNIFAPQCFPDPEPAQADQTAAPEDRRVPRVAAEVVKLSRKAARQEEALAQFKLGVAYANGDGVPQDHATAAKWYLKAADKGDASAQRALGWAYDLGLGVPRDSVEAAHWFRKAAEQGDAEAQSVLGAAYANGHGVSKDAAEAAKWYRQAAEQGHVLAQYDLGRAYFNGLGVPQDFVEAYKWSLLGAAKVGAIDISSQIRSRMTPEQIAEGQKRADEFVAKTGPAVT